MQIGTKKAQMSVFKLGIGLSIALWVGIVAWVSASTPMVALTGGSSAREFNGPVLEWEWIDVGQSALTVERNAGCCTTRVLTDQTAARMVPGLGVSIASTWLRDAWWAALILTVFSWLLVTWLVAFLVREATRSEGAPLGGAIGPVTGCLLAMTSPGFLAYVGNIDAHQFGYFGAGFGIALVTRPMVSITAPFPDSRLPLPVTSRPVLEALGLVVCDGTLQLGVPLLALL